MQQGMFKLMSKLATIFYLTTAISTAHAITFTVDSVLDADDKTVGDGKCLTLNGACSLRAAIQETNALVNGATTDKIVLPAGSYKNTRIGSKTASMKITDSVDLVGDGMATTIIDGMTLDRVIGIIPKTAGSQITVSISGVTIQNGLVSIKNTPNLLESSGGGIYVDSGVSLTVNNATIRKNRAYSGSGMFINDKTFGITIKNSIIEDNGIPEMNTASGAGLFFNQQGNVFGHIPDFIINTTIKNNTANYCAGFFSRTNLFVINSTINNNSSKINTTITDPQLQGGFGGALCVFKGHVDVINSTVSGNTADTSGGGMFFAHVNGVTMYNSTVNNNTADADGDGIGIGGGIYNNHYQSGVRVSLSSYNSIIAGNTDNGTAPDCHLVVRLLNYNIIGDSTGCTILDKQLNDKIGTVDAKINPLLAPLKNNGGLTDTHSLLEGSPAIDAGNPDGCVENIAGDIIKTDQRGQSGDLPNNRAIDGGSGSVRCDVGAYEFKPGNANTVIQADAGPNQTVNTETVVALDGTKSRADKGISLYRWTEVLSTTVTLNDSTLVRPTFTAPAESGTLKFRLTITDTTGQTAVSEVTITVNKNQPGTTQNNGSGNSSSGGGGCSVTNNSRFDPMLILLCSLFLLISLKRRKTVLKD